MFVDDYNFDKSSTNDATPLIYRWFQDIESFINGIHFLVKQFSF